MYSHIILVLSFNLSDSHCVENVPTFIYVENLSVDEFGKRCRTVSPASDPEYCSGRCGQIAGRIEGHRYLCIY